MAFKKIDEGGSLPGPRALFYSGFSEETSEILKNYFSGKGLENINIIPCREDSLEAKVSEVLEGGSSAPVIEAEKLPPVMLWSGLAHSELDIALGGFSETGLKRPIFATTTEPNLEFTIKELLRHLISEQKQMREAMAKQNSN